MLCNTPVVVSDNMTFYPQYNTRPKINSKFDNFKNILFYKLIILAMYVMFGSRL